MLRVGSNGRGYSKLSAEVRTVIDEDLTHIGLLLQTGDYREVKYSAVDSNGALACKIFTKSLGQDVKQYIVAGLRACVESAGRCHSVAGLARSIDAAAHELCFATDERERQCTVSELRLWRVDGRFFCVSRAQFEAALEEGALNPHSYLRVGDTYHVI